MSDIKIGFGFYQHMLAEENYRFARQCGATHAVVHLVDYFNQGPQEDSGDSQPVGDTSGWGYAGATTDLWTLDSLREIKNELNEHGLEFAAIENFDPAHWHDVLLDGPRKHEQIEHLKQIVRMVGEAGVGIIGYNFSIAGVAGRITGPFARGGAESVGMDGADQTPIPQDIVWNMVYDPDAPAGTLPEISHEELWRRLGFFLKELVPVAEEAGVMLAAHPDDPPVPVLRRQPRLVYQPHLYQRLLDIYPSSSNALEFCLGTLTEMTEGDVYTATERYVAQEKVAYIHFRNVRGEVPHYRETFIDEGDLDMVRIMRILKQHDYDGMIIPDHTPQMSCDAPWHAGMAYAIGYMQALNRAVEA